MSRGSSNYECMCGGNITEQWDNNDLKINCDKDCPIPYPKEMWNDIKNIVEKGVEYKYRGTAYYQCQNMYYVEVAENSGKFVYNSFESEELAKKWIDESSTQIIL